MQQKDRAFHKTNKHNYYCLRERLHKQIITSKRKFNAKISNSNPKRMWRLIKNITHPANNSFHNINVNIDALNKVFSDVFINNATDAPDYEEDNFVCSNLEEHDVYKAIKSIKSNAPGPDKIPGSIFKSFAFNLSYPLLLIIQKSIDTSTVPQNWKKANVIPIPKGSGKEYRPISLLSFASKVMEKIVLQAYLAPNVIQYANKNQFAFLPVSYTGTTNALLNVRLDILNKLTTDGGYIRLIAIDFLKAFDKVSHSVILREAYNSFHFPSSIVLWLKSFLHNRLQRVYRDDNNCAKWVSCTSGVPQGSILGPTLFCLVTNSLQPSHERSRIILYADDVTLIHHVPPNLIDNTQSEINHILQWAQSNNMFINDRKCHLLNISLSSTWDSATLNDIYINNTKLSPEKDVKLLGVVIANDMSLKSHASNIVNKCTLGMAAVRRLYQCGFSSDLLWQCYNALVFSHMAYAWPAVCDIPLTFLKNTSKFTSKLV